MKKTPSIRLPHHAVAPHDAGPPCANGVDVGTLADRITAILSAQIRQCECVPEARLPSENALAGRFLVRRTMIREAISRIMVREGRDRVAEDFGFHAAISDAAHHPLHTSLPR